MEFDLHRHDEYSTFDGYGKAVELANLAKEYGYNSLSTTNHGNTNGLIQTYMACKELGLKAILGVEGYFLPKYKEQTRGYHLILIAKDLKGYNNLNRIQYEGEKQKYYNPIWDFKILEKYHEGLICTSACVAGYLAQCILKDELDKAEKYLKKMKSIFKDDFYIEIQPYKVSEKGMQERVNIESIKLAKKLEIKCILTSDSHIGRKEDFDTYMKMHEIANHNFEDIKATYEERYMPKPGELSERFINMHKNDFKNIEKMANNFTNNLSEIEDKCKINYLDELPLMLPKLGDNSTKKIINDIKEGLKKKGKYNKDYINRCKEEFEVIKYHGFEDYFLIVADYVNWAKQQGINVGPGRGSVCNSLVAYALGITEVDSLIFGLDFRRFLRKDKKSFPDIDLDFETSRRHEVIEYLCEKYKGHAARICSYGLYKVDNLLNDLFKVSGLDIDKNTDEVDAKIRKNEIQRIKTFVKNCIDENQEQELDVYSLLNSEEGKNINIQYDNILKHFSKLYKKVRFIGTHAAGVAITGGNILDYVALRVDKNGDVFTNYDLTDIELINVIKFDILGLKTMESIGDLRKSTGVKVNYDEAVNDKKILESFKNGNCDGIFQFEKQTARDILNKIDCDCFEDVVAASSMNRPGPLSLKQPDLYANNKVNIEDAKQSDYYEYTKETYGTIIYQEQVQQISINVGKLTWGDADKVMKLLKGGKMTETAKKLYNENKERLLNEFIKGAKENGWKEEDAKDLFDKMTCYTFNKGHGVGYSLISVEEMFYKIYYPNEYWFAKLKYAKDEVEVGRFSAKAVKDGSIIFLPHVNYSEAKTKLRKVEGENAIQLGMSDIKGVGEKAAEYILEERKRNGVFKSFDDFYDRCKSRVVTSRVIDILKEQGALEFNKKIYISRVTKYNSSLYARANS